MVSTSTSKTTCRRIPGFIIDFGNKQILFTVVVEVREEEEEGDLPRKEPVKRKQEDEEGREGKGTAIKKKRDVQEDDGIPH